VAEVTILKSKSGFQWIDIFNPKRADVEELARQHSLHSTSVQDALDPEHLPKFEKFSSYNFLILRGFDEKSPIECDEVEELSRKVAIFYNDQFLITIHRKDQPHLAQLREKWKIEFETRDLIPPSSLLAELIKRIVLTYEMPIDEGLNRLEHYEMGIFNAPGAKPFTLENGYYLKRKAFVFKRILRLSSDALIKISGTHEMSGTPYFQDVKETLDNLLFYADDLVENASALLNLHISIQQQKTNEASHRTNEVMRILTIFSVFFMPLNFLASIYGMNFEYMPELRLHHGYPLVLVVMFSTAVAIFFWFRRKGWM
jgi:magnesium transporter